MNWTKQIKTPKFWLLMTTLVLVLAACGSDEPENNENDINVQDDTRINITFDDVSSFETGDFAPDGELSIADGRYLIQTTNVEDPTFLWASSNWHTSEQNYPEYKNTTVEVSATTLDGDEDNWHGVLCRVDPAGEGYAFVIGADGFWAIGRTDGRTIDFLETWQQSDAIRTGLNQTNELQAYCLNDYLSFYVNGDFVGDYAVQDDRDRINRIGGAGLIAGGVSDAETMVSFDDFSYASAELKDDPNTPAPITDTPEPTPTIEPLDVPGLGDDDDGFTLGDESNAPPNQDNQE